MKYVHTTKVSDEEAHTSKHDDDLEDSYKIEELFNDTETRSNDEVGDNELAPVVEKLQSDFADVTLVRDDRDPVENHKPCTSCGRKTHSSHRS